MTRILCHADRSALPAAFVPGEIHVVLYDGNPTIPGTATIGGQLPDLASRLCIAPRVEAFDFLTIALAVTAADTFVMRSTGENAWSRKFEISLPLARAELWRPLRKHLEAALLFLSGDQWTFEFTDGGPMPPANTVVRSRRRVVDMSKGDCVCLFSGGLDSAIGVLDLLAAGRRPILVSHSARYDRERQDAVAGLLGVNCQRFSANAYPTWNGADDDSMRTRSFLFIGYAVLVATALADFRSLVSAELFVPENGVIALNAPLTHRRLGSLSTRTAHPHFLEMLQTIFERVHLPLRVRNPYRHTTKGEMLSSLADDEKFHHLAAETVSCGKWKREGTQCGRCVPCLIRRASFFAAGISDRTVYRCPDLTAVFADEDSRDDIIAISIAVQRAHLRRIEPWVLSAGPLPYEAEERNAYFDVFKRGLDELGQYFSDQGLVS